MIAAPVTPISTTNTITSNRSITSVLTPRRSITAARRDLLRTLNMATSQAQARTASSSSSSAKGGGKTRTSARLIERDDGSAGEGTAVNGYQHAGEGKKEQLERSKKRKADYDEQVGDFVFSRAEPKKQKPSAAGSVTMTEQPIMEESEPEPRKQQQQTGQKRKTRSKATDTTANSTSSTKPQRKTSKQNSVEPTAVEDSESPRRTRRRVDYSDPATGKTKKKKKKVDETKDPDKLGDGEMNGAHTPQQEKESQTHATTIALPFADTPVMSRNKEMRMGKEKGQRRSSLGKRGRRASSLIDSGASNALPHDKVSTAEFYKHIGDEGLPEPRRMRQLLTWCATRAIGEKPSGSRSEDESARLAARVIQEELLKDFSNKSELSNWFDREDSAPPKVVVKKPNPKNVQNAEKIKELEEQIQRLQEQRQELSALLRPPSIPPITKPLAPPHEPQDGERYPASQQRRKPEPEPIDPSLLDPSQHPFLNILTPPATHSHPRDQEKQKQRPRHREPTPSQAQAQASAPSQQPQQEEDTTPHPPSSTSTSTSHHPAEISTRLSHLTSSLPSTIDAFASGIHDIELYRDTADRVAGRVLGICAKRLEERDRVLDGRWDGDSHSHGHGHDHRNSPDGGTDEGGSGSGGGDSKGKGRAKDRDRDRGGGGEEDIGLVLGALSRVERR